MRISVQGVGRLTHDPELRSTPSGKSVATLRIAADRRDREAPPVYVDVVAWEGLADTAAAHLTRGREITFNGRLDYQEWEADDPDKTKRSKHVIIADELHFGPRRASAPAPA